MLLGRSRGADAACFCSELLIRLNDLQNRNLHFDKKTPTRNAEFDFSVSEHRRSSSVVIKNLSILTKEGLGLTT